MAKIDRNPYRRMNADALGKLYRFLQAKDQNKKFKKTIDPKQITLDDAIRAAEKRKKNDKHKNQTI